MIKSTEIKNLAIALSKFQSEMQTVPKEAINPFFKSKYADLTSIIEAIKKPLSLNGLSFTQFPTAQNQLTTILMHASGEFLEETVSIFPIDCKPQSIGSALSYMRRYALSAVLGIATEDDDGNVGSLPQPVYIPENIRKPVQDLGAQLTQKEILIDKKCATCSKDFKTKYKYANNCYGCFMIQKNNPNKSPNSQEISDEELNSFFS